MANEADVPWLLSVIIGVFSAGGVKLVEQIITWSFDKSKNTNAQRDSDLAVFKAITFEVRDLASSYWAISGKNAEKEAAISGRLFFLGALIDSLFEKEEIIIRDCHVAMNRFDTACTGGNFGTHDRVHEPEKISKVEISAYTLVHTVERARRKL